jgi:hypothetical protein
VSEVEPFRLLVARRLSNEGVNDTGFTVVSVGGYVSGGFEANNFASGSAAVNKLSRKLKPSPAGHLLASCALTLLPKLSHAFLLESQNVIAFSAFLSACFTLPVMSLT